MTTVKKWSALILAVAVLGASLSSCQLIPLYRNVKFDEAAWTAAKAKWEAAGIMDYSYRLSSYGFMPFESIVTVTGGSSATEIVAPDAATPEAMLSGRAQSMDAWFADIRESFDSVDGKWIPAEDYPVKEIAVTYDPEYGFPTEIEYIYGISLFIAVDGNFFWTLGDFTPTP